MSDQDRQISFEHEFIHDDRIASAGRSQIDHVIRIFGVMTDDLSGVPEFIEQFLTEDRFRVFISAAGVQSVGDDKQDILLINTCTV